MWLGYDEAELVGHKRFSDLLSVGSRMFHQTHWLPLLQMQGSVAEVQFELQHKERRRLPALVNAIRHEDRHDLAVFAADDRRKYEDELLRARRRAEELLESERRAQKQLAEAQAQRAILGEQLVGIVSHDLRTPLSVISVGSALLAASPITTAQATLLRRIDSANRRAVRLVSDLLDFTQARLGSGLLLKPGEIELPAVVADAVEDLKLAWPGRLLEFRERGARTALWADADRISQIVSNLAGNALTYGDAERVVTITAEVDGEAAVVTVHNWGPPIPEGLLPHLFEPMRRGDQQVKLGSRSVGLGLYIVSEIAVAHGGKVTVSSSLAAGTLFTVTLPLQPRSPSKDARDGAAP